MPSRQDKHPNPIEKMGSFFLNLPIPNEAIIRKPPLKCSKDSYKRRKQIKTRNYSIVVQEILAPVIVNQNVKYPFNIRATFIAIH
ncbi:hypothetical protein CUU64_11370 [Bacillus sp. V5-8f]|nr:hypothetical protein CUU64_11370 [Bacillus sp. V5-8f]